jgi:hypothetical protein
MDRDVLIRGIKIIDIVFITVLYFIVGIAFAFVLDVFFQSWYGDYQGKNSILIFVECLVEITVVAILAYLGRNILQLVPFPLDGVYGFKHLLVPEVKVGGTLVMAMTVFFSNLRNKLDHLRQRFQTLVDTSLQKL